MNIKNLVRSITPPLFLDIYRSYRHGTHLGYIWKGIYQHYKDVPATGEGFDGAFWVNTTHAYTKRVISGLKQNGVVPTGVPTYHSLLGLLVSTYKPSDTVRILDFGGGMGVSFAYLTNSLVQHCHLEYHVVDSQKSCDLGAEIFKNDPRICFHASLPVDLKDVDIIYLSGVIQFVEDYSGLLDALAQYKPKHFLYVFLPSGDVPTYASAQMNVRGSVTPSWFINAGEIIDRMAEKGYSLVFKGAMDREFDMSNFPERYRLKHMANLLFSR